MYNYKIVEQVTRKKKAMSDILRGIMIVFAVLFILFGIVFSRGFMLPGFLLVVLYFAFDAFSQKDYEYVLDNGIFSVDVIYGKRFRKAAHELDLKELVTVAPNWHQAVAKYRNNGGSVRLPKYDYTSYEENIPYYTMIVGENGRQIKLLLDLTDEMLQALKRMYPEKVYLQ